jgi:hypothetical protein
MQARLKKILATTLFAGVLVTVPLGVSLGRGLKSNNAKCEANTCCYQFRAACPYWQNYYDKGCPGPCGEPCPKEF